MHKLAKKDFVAWVERRAQDLRQKLSLSSHAALDPYALAKCMRVQIVLPSDIHGLSAEDIRHLLEVDSGAWSGGVLHTPSGRVVVVLNPTHSETRKRATLMEELSHVYLGHRPSQLIQVNGGLATRSYKKTDETAAYWVGAAALVPISVLEYAKNNGVGQSGVARQYSVSAKLVDFRTRVTGIRLSQ